MKKLTIPHFNAGSVLVIGDVMLDRYWFGDTGRISPEAPVPVVRVKQIDDRPGGAGNVALNLAALGTKTTLLGITGDDDAGRILQDQLTSNGIQSEIQQQNHAPTITKLRVISRHQQLLRLDFEEKFPAFNPETLLNTFKKALTKSNLVILSDYNKGTLTIAPELIALAKAANVPVLVDPKGTDFHIYRGADIITPNLKEFETVVGSCANEEDILAKGKAFLQQHHIQALLLTRGENGMTLIQQDSDEFHLPAHAREVFDVTGAGDTVIATLGAALAAKATLHDAVALANLAASLVVSKLGAATVTPLELEAVIHDPSLTHGHVVNDEQLLLAVNHARHQGKKIVFTNGCFDILHAGHVTYLQQAKQLGDYLVVAINDDDSITRLKGPTRPINKVDQRMTVLAALGAVDCVVSFADDTPHRLLKMLKPDILVKGGDYTIDQVVGREVVQTYGGNVRVLGMTKGVSATAIIDRIVQHVTTPQPEMEQ